MMHTTGLSKPRSDDLAYTDSFIPTAPTWTQTLPFPQAPTWTQRVA